MKNFIMKSILSNTATKVAVLLQTAINIGLKNRFLFRFIDLCQHIEMFYTFHVYLCSAFFVLAFQPPRHDAMRCPAHTATKPTEKLSVR